MKFGAEIVPYYNPEKMNKLGEKIENSGFDYLWVADHYHNRYVHSILAHLTDITERIQLGPGVTNPYLVHPSVTAAAVATLDELSGGRATLGISAGDPTYLNSIGIKHEKPITAVREAIKIIKSLLNGEKTDFKGEIFTCREAKLRFSQLHEIPIYVGGRGPQMLKLAGELADGALFNASHPKDLEECIDLVEEGAKEKGRDLSDFDKVAYMATSIGENEEEVRNKSRVITSFVAASAPESTIERENISKERIQKIRENLMNNETKKAKELVTEKMIEIFSVTGTIDKLEKRIEEVKKLGITQVVIGSPIGPDTDKALEKISKTIN